MQQPPFPLMEQSEYPSPIGLLQIGIVEHALAWIGLPSLEKSTTSKKNSPSKDSISMKQIKIALENYFSNSNYQFELPLFIQGTFFQKKVWQALQSIPWGSTKSYNDLAIELKTHPRAIGNACRTNRIPIVIPCHRITAKAGLGGYGGKLAGDWPAIKQWLLTHEKIV